VQLVGNNLLELHMRCQKKRLQCIDTGSLGIECSNEVYCRLVASRFIVSDIV